MIAFYCIVDTLKQIIKKLIIFKEGGGCINSMMSCYLLKSSLSVNVVQLKKKNVVIRMYKVVKGVSSNL